MPSDTTSHMFKKMSSKAIWERKNQPHAKTSYTVDALVEDISFKNNSKEDLIEHKSSKYFSIIMYIHIRSLNKLLKHGRKLKSNIIKIFTKIKHNK